MEGFIAPIVCLFLAVFTAWYLLCPLFEIEREHRDDQPGRGEERREQLLQMVQDLELDYATGKLSESEYNRMKAGIAVELNDVLTKLDARANG